MMNMNKFAMMFAVVVLAGCANGDVRESDGVDGDAQELSSTRCKGLIYSSPELTTSSRDNQRIAIRPSKLYGVVNSGVGDDAGWALAIAMSHAMVAKTGDETMSYPPATISAAIRALKSDTRFSICRYEWSTVTNETTGEVFQW